MRLLLPEIFERVEKASTLAEKKEILVKNNSPVMTELLKLNFDASIKFKLPEGTPPFKKEGVPMGLADSNLYKEMRRMYVWINPPENLHKIKRETLFIQLLESINEKEAVLICAIKDKELDKLYPSVTYDLVNETFPGLLPPKPAVVEKQQEVISAPKKRGRPKKVA
jgi:hypothetical protein